MRNLWLVEDKGLYSIPEVFKDGVKTLKEKGISYSLIMDISEGFKYGHIVGFLPIKYYGVVVRGLILDHPILGGYTYTTKDGVVRQIKGIASTNGGLIFNEYYKEENYVSNIKINGVLSLSTYDSLLTMDYQMYIDRYMDITNRGYITVYKNNKLYSKNNVLGNHDHIMEYIDKLSNVNNGWYRFNDGLSLLKINEYIIYTDVLYFNRKMERLKYFYDMLPRFNKNR